MVLENTGLSDEGIKTLSTLVEHCSSVVSLDLRQNPIDDLGALKSLSFKLKRHVG